MVKTRYVLDLDPFDAHDLIRYLDGDHHMGVYDRSKVTDQLREQTRSPRPAETQDTGRSEPDPDAIHNHNGKDKAERADQVEALLDAGATGNVLDLLTYIETGDL